MPDETDNKPMFKIENVVATVVMEITEKIVSLGRAARSRKNLKVRQPLAKLIINLPDGQKFESLNAFLDVIKDEKHIEDELFDTLYSLGEELSKILFTMIKKLSD